jgi:hypothetical protein
MPSMIYFTGRDQGVPVNEPAEQIVDELRRDVPIRLSTVEGAVIFANWSNVLYLTAPGDQAAGQSY